MVVPKRLTVVSVNAVLIVLRVAGFAAPLGSLKGAAPTVMEVSVGVPTTNPAEVIIVLAVESAVPCCYSRLSCFS
jgi:hypothetical protein